MSTTFDIRKQVFRNLKYKNNSKLDLSMRVKKNDGSAYTLTGKTIRMDVKNNRNDQSYVYRLTSASEITISDTNLLTFDKVMDLPKDQYVYDIYIVDDGYYIMGGLILVERNITT